LISRSTKISSRIPEEPSLFIFAAMMPQAGVHGAQIRRFQ
jgi:hypothetical protein